MASLAPTGPTPHPLDRLATTLFVLACKEGWPGHLLYHLFEGGGATFDMETRRPILIARAEIEQAILGSDDE